MTLLVDGSMWIELRIAVGESIEEIAMNTSKLTRLVRKLRLWLPVVYWLLRIAIEVADIVSKAVTYHTSKVRKLQPLLPVKRQVRFCTV